MNTPVHRVVFPDEDCNYSLLYQFMNIHLSNLVQPCLFDDLILLLRIWLMLFSPHPRTSHQYSSPTSSDFKERSLRRSIAKGLCERCVGGGRWFSMAGFTGPVPFVKSLFKRRSNLSGLVFNRILRPVFLLPQKAGWMGNYRMMLVGR